MSSTTLSHNINIINNSGHKDSLHRLQSSPLAPFLSRSGLPTLKYKDTLIHSGYDPMKEARKLIHIDNPDNSTLIFVMGLGYGYHIRELLHQLGDRKAHIFIFEWDRDIFTSAMHHANLDFLKDERLHLFVGDNFWHRFQQIISSIETSSVRGGSVYYLKSEYLLFRTEYDLLVRQLNETIQREFQNRLTSLEFEKLWIRNLIRNAHCLFQHRDVSELFGGFTGQRAVIVSAGPSLRLSLPILKKYREHHVLVATDTALNPLLQFNIIPDFIVSLDGQFHNYRDFWTSPASLNSCLLYDLTVFPAIPNSIGGQKYYFSSNHRSGGTHPLINRFNSLLNIDITSVAGGGSVATAALEISRLLGFEHIILTGQDLSYTHLVSHCSGTPHYDLCLMKTNRWNPLETQFHRIIHSRQIFSSDIVPDLKTDFILGNLHKWLEDYALTHQSVRDNGMSFLLNATPLGLPIKNIPGVSLEDLLKTPSQENKLPLNLREPYDRAFDGVRGIPRDKRELTAMFHSLRQSLRSFFDVLLEELDREEPHEIRIESVKSDLEDSHPYLRYIYEKEDLWYKRKPSKSKDDLYIYTNILLRVTRDALHWLRKAGIS